MTPRPGSGVDAERGAAALLVASSGLVLLLATVAMFALVTDIAASRTRARTAADAAALAAMAASPLAGGDGDPCGAAASLAAANGAQLVACPVTTTPQPPLAETGWPLRVRVTVQVAPATPLARRLVGPIRAEAAAALRPVTSPTVPDPDAASSSGRPAAADATGLLPPVDGPVTSGFGMRVHPVLGTRRLHAGIDYAAPVGTPIRAAASGRVAFAGWRGGYGRTVVLDHGDGRTTLYAHQSRVGVAAGQRVAAGAVIGAVGSSGLSTGPHLHFELRVGGVPVDPLSAGMAPTVELELTLRR